MDEGCRVSADQVAPHSCRRSTFKTRFLSGFWDGDYFGVALTQCIGLGREEGDIIESRILSLQWRKPAPRLHWMIGLDECNAGIPARPVLARSLALRDQKRLEVSVTLRNLSLTDGVLTAHTGENEEFPHEI